MNKFGVILSLVFLSLTSCTFNVSMAHTQGRARDTIDTSQDPKAKFDADVDIPILPEKSIRL